MECTQRSLSLIRSIAILILLAVVPTLSFGQLSNNLPDHVRQSFAWGITDNQALNRSDLESLAQVVLVKTEGLSFEAAQSRAKGLSEKILRELCTRNFLIEYVEVPLRELKTRGETQLFVSQYLPDDTSYSPVRFMKNGEEHVRWFIHPLRTDLSFLEKIGQPKIMKGQFLAQMTESRSVVIMDRKSGHYWSIKLSLPVSVGPWKQKTFTSRQAETQFRSSEHLLGRRQSGAYKDTQFIHEQEAFSFSSQSFNEGQLVRSLSILKSGGYLLPYSAIYSFGLARYLPSLNKSVERIQKAEERWLTQEPGQAAADLYFADGLVANSNHSQNSLLLLSPSRQPLSYIRRDMDFELDGQNFANSPVRSYFSEKNMLTPGINFSMTNGFKGKSYYSERSDALAEGFFLSFMNRYLNRQGKPSEKISIMKRLEIRGGHYFLPTYSLKSSQELYELAVEGNRALLETRSERFPELRQFQADPEGTLRRLLSREDQRLGWPEDYMGLLEFFWREELKAAWRGLINEYMNPRTRGGSLILRAVHEPEEAMLWNISIVAGRLFSSDQEAFVSALLNDAAKSPKGKATERVFSGMKFNTLPRPILRSASDMPQWYWRLLGQYEALFGTFVDPDLKTDFSLLHSALGSAHANRGSGPTSNFTCRDLFLHAGVAR